MEHTKDKIWRAALGLFSKHGYDGVSMMNIAEKVGIKDSSIYKHYKSKKEIFNEIHKQVDTRISNEHFKLNAPLEETEASKFYSDISTDELENISLSLIDFYLNDEILAPYRRMLNIEQYSNSEVADRFKSFFIDSALSYQTSIFEILVKNCKMNGDPDIMALHFYSPLFLLIFKYDNEDTRNSAKLKNEVIKHVNAFSQIYLIH